MLGVFVNCQFLSSLGLKRDRLEVKVQSGVDM